MEGKTMVDNDRRNSVGPFKIVGLITAVVTILSLFVGVVTWISSSMANNSVSIEALRNAQLRHEVLIGKNSEIIHQHAQLLAIIKEHSKSIDILTDFMTKGGRFTEQDGDVLRDQVLEVKEQLHSYDVMSAELGWIKSSINRMELDLNKKLDSLANKVDDVVKDNKRRNGELLR